MQTEKFPALSLQSRSSGHPLDTATNPNPGSYVNKPHVTQAKDRRGRLATVTIILLATPEVIASAERAVNFIIELHMGPHLTREEVRQKIEGRSLNAISEFARCCREELIALRLV
jgi:hypothetical protein